MSRHAEVLQVLRTSCPAVSGPEGRKTVAHGVSRGSQVPKDHQPQRGDRHGTPQGRMTAKPQSCQGGGGERQGVDRSEDYAGWLVSESGLPRSCVLLRFLRPKESRWFAARTARRRRKRALIWPDCIQTSTPFRETRSCVAWVTISSGTHHFTPFYNFLLHRTPPLWFKVI